MDEEEEEEIDFRRQPCLSLLQEVTDAPLCTSETTDEV